MAEQDSKTAVEINFPRKGKFSLKNELSYVFRQVKYNTSIGNVWYGLLINIF